MTDVTQTETDQVAAANSSGKTPVVFVHGLWLLPGSWDKWREAFTTAGFSTLAPGWPDDPASASDGNANPQAFAGKTVGQVADHMEAVIRKLDKPPAVIGHSFGGLLAQILAGRGLAKVTVAIDPAPFQGVLPLPISALKSASPVLRNLTMSGGRNSPPKRAGPYSAPSQPAQLPALNSLNSFPSGHGSSSTKLGIGLSSWPSCWPSTEPSAGRTKGGRVMCPRVSTSMA